VSELSLTLVRLGFLALLWFFVVFVLVTLRRDLRGPREPNAPISPAPPKVRPAPKTRAGRTSKKASPNTLVVTEGSLVGTVIPLAGNAITMGRAPDNTVVIDDDYASGHHARLTPASDGNWIIEDLGSTNGTWLDRNRITAPTVLPLGVPMRIGRTSIELRS